MADARRIQWEMCKRAEQKPRRIPEVHPCSEPGCPEDGTFSEDWQATWRCPAHNALGRAKRRAA